MTQLIKISLEGLGCEHCVKTVNSALKNLNGIINADTILDDSVVNIEYDDSLVGFQQIKQTIENAGYGVIE